MADRLPVDANVLGYWGLDESLETDIAFDESSGVNNLTVNSSPSVVLGRIGNARQFNGSSTFASPVGSSAPFRLQGDLTLIAWAKIDSYNSGGSLLRTLISCGGPTTGDPLLYSLGVDNGGRLVYKHTSSSGLVVVRTAINTIRTGQIYSIAVRRVASGPNQVIEVFVDNVQKTIADVTVNAVSSSLPVPPPISNASAVFSLGRSQLEADSAFWVGTLDEVSLHNVARLNQPYLRAAYYRIALSNDLGRLTYFDNILTISSYEMGGGVRWWCYERDKDLYVVKESPFGNFLPEVRLTTVGGGSASLTVKPELIYDPATDTLLVLFSSGNRIFKLTAQSTDDAATINMPYTADTGGIIKAVDNVEGGRFGLGGGQSIPSALDYVNRQPVKLGFLESMSLGFGDSGIQVLPTLFSAPQIIFMTIPGLGFGVVIGNTTTRNFAGYVLYRMDGASFVSLTPTFLPTLKWYFVPIATRSYGTSYVAEILSSGGQKTGIFSNSIVDRFNQALEYPGGEVIALTRDSDGADTASTGLGGGQTFPNSLDYINRSPVKLSFQDTPSSSLGIGGGLFLSISSTGRGTLLL